MITEEKRKEDSKFCWFDKNDKFHRVNLIGRKLIIRRCKRNEDEFIVNPDGEKKKLTPEFLDVEDALIDTLSKNTPTFIGEVMAVGPDCGTPRTEKERKRLGLKKHYWPRPEKGWLALMPERDETGKMRRGITGYRFDVACEDYTPIAYITD